MTTLNLCVLAMVAITNFSGCYRSHRADHDPGGGDSPPVLDTVTDGACPDIGLQCGGLLGPGYCQHPAGALYSVEGLECPTNGCDPLVVDGTTYETLCVRNQGDTGDICAITCGDVVGPPTY